MANYNSTHTGTEIDNAVDKCENLESVENINNTVARALKIPVSALSDNELVGVGTMTDQIRIQLGDGLELTGSTSPYTLRVVAYDGTVE